MEKRVNSLETDLELLKKDMSACQASIRQDINHLKDTRAELPSWLKNSAVGIIFAIFSQTIASVWWASQISSGQNNMALQVAANTTFINNWPIYFTHCVNICCVVRVVWMTNHNFSSPYVVVFCDQWVY